MRINLSPATIHRIEMALVSWANQAEADRVALAEFRTAVQLAAEADARQQSDEAQRQLAPVLRAQHAERNLEWSCSACGKPGANTSCNYCR